MILEPRYVIFNRNPQISHRQICREVAEGWNRKEVEIGGDRELKYKENAVTSLAMTFYPDMSFSAGGARVDDLWRGFPVGWVGWVGGVGGDGWGWVGCMSELRWNRICLLHDAI